MAGANSSADKNLVMTILKKALSVAHELFITEDPPQPGRQGDLPAMSIPGEHEHALILLQRFECQGVVAQDDGGCSPVTG